jgi:hypothetical protein
LIHFSLSFLKVFVTLATRRIREIPENDRFTVHLRRKERKERLLAILARLAVKIFGSTVFNGKTQTSATNFTD